jgi:hypothetical protein
MTARDQPGRRRSRIYRPRQERTFANDECFLCGIALDGANRSDEHVIPAWVQREFDLWNQRLVLLNGTDIPYRQLVIPCCRDCNSGPLSDIEQAVQRSWAAGFDAFVQLDRDLLFLWLASCSTGCWFASGSFSLIEPSPTRGRSWSPSYCRSFASIICSCRRREVW